MSWDVNRAVAQLKKQAHAKSQGRCAQYTRQAIEAGGVTLARRGSAKDYGLSLVAVGFRVAVLPPGAYMKGDVSIIAGFEGHPHGHMAMFDGEKWISDFVQRSLYPGGAYRKHQPAYRFYRHGVVSAELNRGTGDTFLI
jgi:hypothetical protein